MKNIKSIFITLGFMIALAIASCGHDDAPSLGEPFSQVEGISDDWELIEIYQVDELTKSQNKEIEVTDLMIGNNPASISFNSSTKSYSATAGDSKLFFPLSGTWAFDDDTYPTTIIVNADGKDLELDLLQPVRESVDQYLFFKATRPIGDCAEIEAEAAVGYAYKFKRK